VRFEARDVTQVADTGGFDLIFTFDAIHDQANPQSVLQEIHRLLADDGTSLMQDIKASSHVENNLSHPLGTFIYTISCLHCMTVSLAQNGKGLGAAWGKELAMKMLDAAGFQSIQVHELEHDIQNYYYVCRKQRRQS
jgi:2-polyprenyl-3-methyl-5-hydroxy-6-metoxy-1,4-benzoquinol methylase